MLPPFTFTFFSSHFAVFIRSILLLLVVDGGSRGDKQVVSDVFLLSSCSFSLSLPSPPPSFPFSLVATQCTSSTTVCSFLSAKKKDSGTTRSPVHEGIMHRGGWMCVHKQKLSKTWNTVGLQNWVRKGLLMCKIYFHMQDKNPKA